MLRVVFLVKQLVKAKGEGTPLLISLRHPPYPVNFTGDPGFVPLEEAWGSWPTFWNIHLNIV